MPTTEWNSIAYPNNTDAENFPSVMGAMDTKVGLQAVPRFTNTTARDAAIPSPLQGQACYVTADQKYYVYNTVGTPAWIQHNITQSVIGVGTETRTSTTTPTNSQLIYPLRANRRYHYEIACDFSGDPVSGIAWKLLGTATSTGRFFWRGTSFNTPPTNRNIVVLGQASINNYQGVAFPANSLSNDTFATPLYIWGIIDVGATAGNLVFQWCQQTSSALTASLGGHYMIITEVT